MQNLIKRLEKRGWNKKEVSKAVGIIKNAKQDRGNGIIFLEKRIYWILLIVIIVANFAISVSLIPILIALKGMLLYIVLIITGGTFGLLFELVIRSIEHLEKKHHVILAILLPVIALVNVFMMSRISNGLMEELSLTNLHNSIVIALVYAAAFVVPYLVYRFILKKEYYLTE